MSNTIKYVVAPPCLVDRIAVTNNNASLNIDVISQSKAFFELFSKSLINNAIADSLRIASVVHNQAIAMYCARRLVSRTLAFVDSPRVQSHGVAVDVFTVLVSGLF